MKSFIFYTTEGFTSDPNDKAINNTQILGSADGVDVTDAFKNFKQTHSYLQEYAFTSIIGYLYIICFFRQLALKLA